MPHLVLPQLTSDSKTFTIDGENAHHWVRVLRLQAGDVISLHNGQGLRAEGQITSVDVSVPSAEGKIIRVLPSQNRSHRLHLFQGLPRGSKFDFVIEKATELGVDSITPFLSEKNPIDLDAEQAQKKQKRWQSVAEAAAKQSGSSTIPTFEPVLSFDQLVGICKNKHVFLLHPGPRNQSLKEQIQSKMLPAEIGIVIGPESGFTENEAKQLLAVGCIPVSLGERILRTETAGLTVISILNYELGLF